MRAHFHASALPFFLGHGNRATNKGIEESSCFLGKGRYEMIGTFALVLNHNYLLTNNVLDSRTLVKGINYIVPNYFGLLDFQIT